MGHRLVRSVALLSGLVLGPLLACSGKSRVDGLPGSPGSSGGTSAVAGGGSSGGNSAGTTDPGEHGGSGGTAATAACPALGPFGTRAGDVASDVTLLDCDGNEHSLHDLCEKAAGWVIEYADWCPTCRAHARNAAARYDKYAGEDFGAFMIVTEARDGGPPDVDLCAWVRDQYQIVFPVLMDPEDAFQDALGVPPNQTQIVFGTGMIIVHTGSEAGVEAAIEVELGI